MTTGHSGPAPIRLRRYLPLVVLTTASVVVLPAVLVAAFVPRGGSLLMVASAASAVAASVAIASAEAALWTRRPQSRDLVFADLMLWGWLRRCWTGRRLAQARDLYDSARKAGSTVSIELLEALSKRLEERDPYTHGHSRRVARHAERIASAMRLSAAEIAKIRTAAAVHDVGKLYTPREILNNPGRLTDREFAIVKLHPGDGADMLVEVGDPEIAAMVRHHHERIDGHGYPNGLAGSDIPLGARIIAVADTFDAIISSRAYRPAGTHKKALDILSHEAGSQLDGVAVAAFLSRYSARRSIAWFAFAAAVPERIFAALQTASSSLGVSSVGATSILPAIGAAGLLTFSHGLHHDTLINRGTYRQHAVTRPHQLTIPATGITEAQRQNIRQTRQTASTQPTSPAYHLRLRHRTLRTSPSTPLSKNPTTSTPNTPASGTNTPASTNTHASGISTSTHEPAAATPAAPPTTSSAPAPPVSTPPVNGAPTPAPPSGSPVTLPSVPSVPGVPEDPIRSVVIPTVEALTTKILRLG